MIEPTVSQRDAASTLFNLPGYRVTDAIDTASGGRRVLIVSIEPPGCPVCGVISTRVHQRTRQRVRDVPIAGAVEVMVQAAVDLRGGSVRQGHVRGAHPAGPDQGQVDRPAAPRPGGRGGGFGSGRQ